MNRIDDLFLPFDAGCLKFSKFHFNLSSKKVLKIVPNLPTEENTVVLLKLRRSTEYIPTHLHTFNLQAIGMASSRKPKVYIV